MLVLGIESATPVASVALADETGLLGEVSLNIGLTHSEQLLPMIDDLLRQCRGSINEVTHIGVSSGPGSYTGLRIGMATAKALAQGLGAVRASEDTLYSDASGNGRRTRFVSIPTLEAMAWALRGQSVPVSPMLNARKGQIYAGLYAWQAKLDDGAFYNGGGFASQETDRAISDAGHAGHGAGRAGYDTGHAGRDANLADADLAEIFASRQRGKKERMPAGAGSDRMKLARLIAPEAASPESWAKRIAACAKDREPIYLLGDGVDMYREIWERDLGDNAVLLPPIIGLSRGAYVALAAIEVIKERENTRQADNEFYDEKPIYLRGI